MQRANCVRLRITQPTPLVERGARVRVGHQALFGHFKKGSHLGGYVSRNLTFGHPCHVGVTKLASCTCPCSWLVLHVGPVNPHVPEAPTAVRFSGVPRGLRASGIPPP
ncbi:hypothetical protein B296_00053927 [Ensete ventricosum]|uniref:Uncharacterized protein n=1 Tax=Ensete ventricosum TaxID=4639 RepID=A0A426XEW0_ENSVE|nr:hypothetical protein B296_00053927 [Ensete ventricosum]